MPGPFSFKDSMDTDTTAAGARPGWLVRHPFLVIGGVLALGLGPFLTQAIQTDDTLFVWTAQQIAKHPLDFFGFNVNWWSSSIPMWLANYNPPLWPYLLAAAGGVFGWQEVGLHLMGFAVAWAAAAGIYCLARQWCQWPTAGGRDRDFDTGVSGFQHHVDVRRAHGGVLGVGGGVVGAGQCGRAQPVAVFGSGSHGGPGGAGEV